MTSPLCHLPSSILLAIVVLAGSPGARAASNTLPAPGTHGPTLHLDYNRDNPAGDGIASFMYFVPLISPDPVIVTESSGNTQQARVISATRHFDRNSFAVDAVSKPPVDGWLPGNTAGLKR